MAPTIDMRESPYDRGEKTPAPARLVQLRYAPPTRWVPSRFNARTVGEDGRVLLWNTYTGAVTAFDARHREQVLALLSPKGTAGPLGKLGDYMSRRGYLVRSGVSEIDQFRYRYMQQQWRQDVLELILLASEDCNFRCVYCYEKFERGTMAPETREGIKRLVEKRAPQLSRVSLSWFGGEPLYGWEAIADLEPALNGFAKHYGFALGQNMTTNGYLLTEEHATRLLEWGCRKYQITVDGLAEEHDCKRVGRDGSPTYHVILDNLRSLAQRKTDFKVDLRVNFDRANFHRLGQFIETISEDFGGDERFEMHFRPVGRWGGENDDALDICGVSERKDMLRDLQKKAAQAGLGHEGGITQLASFGSSVCYAARPYNLIVGATGKLMKCTVVLYEMEENVVGQLNPDGTVELRDEHMAHWVTPHFERDHLCKNCYVLPSCQGAYCPLTRVQDGRRSCCDIKGNLKHEMRYTLNHSRRQKTLREHDEAVVAG